MRDISDTADAQSRRLLVVIAADYDSAIRKGVDSLFKQFDEDGFFSRVVLLSPNIRRDRAIPITPCIEYREIGWTRRGWWTRLTAPLHLLRLVREGCRLVRRQGITLIRATEPSLCGVVAWVISRLTGVPYCLSLHADYDQRYKLDGARGAPTLFGARWPIMLVERLTLRGALRVLPIRESLVRYALNHGAMPGAVRVIPHGIDLAPYREPSGIDIRARYSIPADGRVLSFAGRLSRENYLDDVLAAVRRVAANREDVYLVLAGGGALERAVSEKVATDPVLTRCVRMAGFVDQDMVRALRQQGDVSLCLMAGYSLIEACAAARPVISYDVEWHHELVIDGETGYLVPEHDVAGVAGAIVALLGDPRASSRMGERARELAFLRHDINVATKIKQGHYKEMLGKNET
jgi:glycosyltransferase involved in cell wall biosynthesis